jgi:MFS family permease
VGLYLQVGIGMSAVMAGLIMGMQAFGAMTVSRYSVKLFKQYGIKKPVTIGLTGLAVLSPAILLIHQPQMIVLGIVLFFIRGLFSGLCGTPIQTLSVLHFSKNQLAQVNSIFNACRQVAISFGIALSSILLSVGLKLNHVNSHLIANYPIALKVFGLGFLMLTIVACVGIYLAQKEIQGDEDA